MLKVINLSKKYKGNENYTFKDLSFEVQKGEIFGILGLNGIGKTTFFKCITGIHSFDTGEVYVNNIDLEKEPIKAKKHIGYIPDNSSTFEELTGNEYINFMASIYKVDNALKEERKKHLAKILKLDLHLNKQIKNYSQGMRQKIAIIGGIIHYPDLWVMDEPLSGLDTVSLEEIIKFMKEYVKLGKTILFSSHILSFLEDICDKIILINDSKIVKIFDLKNQKNKLDLRKEYEKIINAK